MLVNLTVPADDALDEHLGFLTERLAQVVVDFRTDITNGLPTLSRMKILFDTPKAVLERLPVRIADSQTQIGKYDVELIEP